MLSPEATGDGTGDAMRSASGAGSEIALACLAAVLLRLSGACTQRHGSRRVWASVAFVLAAGLAVAAAAGSQTAQYAGKSIDRPARVVGG